MFPLISGVGELLQARQMLEDVKRELAAQGVPFDPELKVGITDRGALGGGRGRSVGPARPTFSPSAPTT